MNSRSDIFRLKLQIEEDRHLSHSARTAGLRICSWIYNHPQHRWAVDDAFPLPWTELSRLLWGASERECYRDMRELVDCGHLGYRGVKGCPGKAHFALIIPDRAANSGSPSTAKSGSPRTANCDSARAAKCDSASSAKSGNPRAATKRSPQISSSLREEIVSPKEVNGSLRSTGTKGGESMGRSAVAPRRNLSDAERQQCAAELRKLNEKLKTA